MIFEDDANREISPPEFIRLNCFPLKDYELSKIYEYHVKIIELLHIIYGYVRLNQDELKTCDDYEKIKRRAAEFSARFSRNQLYPLQRNLDEVKEYFDAGKAFLRKNSERLRRHLTITYQSVYQALQVYQNYIQSARNMQVTEKLTDLLVSIRELNTTCRTVLIPVIETVGHEKEDILEKSCLHLMEYLNTPQKSFPVLAVAQKKKGTKIKQPANPFYMYEGKLSRWKKKSEMLAKLGKKRREEEQKVEVISTNVPSDETIGKKEKVVKKISGKVLKDRDIKTVVETISCEEINTSLSKAHMDAINDFQTEEVAKKKMEQNNVKLCIIRANSLENIEISETKDIDKDIHTETLNRLQKLKSDRDGSIVENKNYGIIEGMQDCDYIGRICDEIYDEYLTEVASELEIDESLLDELFINELEDEVNNYFTRL